MEHDALALIDRLDGGGHLVGRRRSEDLAGAGGVEHAEPDKARMQRLMSRAAARNQRDLAGRQRAAAHELALLAGDNEIGMGGREPVKALLEQRLRRVEKFLHGFLPGLGSNKQRARVISSPCAISRARRRAVSRTSSSNSRFFLASPRSGTSSFRLRRLGASRISRFDWDGRGMNASRNARFSAGGKWQISKMISRCGAGIGTG